MRLWAFCWGWLLLVTVACSGPAAKSALDVIAPIAADALSALIKEKFGDEAEIDVDTAGCFDDVLPADEDDDGYVWILCRAKPVE